MSIRKKILYSTLSLFTAATFSANSYAEKISLGVSTGPHEDVAYIVQEIAAEKGLEIEIVSFADYIVPNAALDAGDIDVNSFQHDPFLQNEIKTRGYDLVAVGKNFLFPMGFYSTKIKDISQLKKGATVAIQNDPTNGGRALLILQNAGLIEIDPNAGITAGAIDVVKNPHNFFFIEMDAPQIPRIIDDVDIASINTDFAVQSGFDPITDTLLKEGGDSPYVNLVVVHSKNVEKPWVKTLMECYHDPKVKAYILERYKGAVVPAW